MTKPCCGGSSGLNGVLRSSEQGAGALQGGSVSQASPVVRVVVRSAEEERVVRQRYPDRAIERRPLGSNAALLVIY